MRTVIVLVLAAATVTGCITASVGGDGSAPPPGSASSRFALDCSISNWMEACSALASPNDSPSKTEIDIVVNPTDPLNVFVASKDMDPLASDACVWSVGQVTKDGGKSWTTVYVGGTLEERASPTHPLFGYRCVTDPIMAFDSKGVLYYPLQIYDAKPSTVTGAIPGPVNPDLRTGFIMMTSADGGETFGGYAPMILAEGTAAYHDYPRMAISPTTDSVSTVFNEFKAVAGGGSFVITPFVATTNDGGKTFSVTEVVAGSVPTLFASGYAAGPDGTYYMTVRTFVDPSNPGPPSFRRSVPMLAISTDDARSFTTFASTGIETTPTPGQLPNSEFRTGTSYELAADLSDGPNAGRLYMVWDDYGAENADVLVAWTDDGGATWTPPAAVAAGPHDQFMPRVVVDGAGVVHATFFDRDRDPENRLLDVTHAWSEDGGATWASERLTTAMFDGDLGIHQNGGSFIGDYIGIAAHGTDVWFGYPTTVTGRAEIAVAHAR